MKFDLVFGLMACAAVAWTFSVLIFVFVGGGMLLGIIPFDEPPKLGTIFLFASVVFLLFAGITAMAKFFYSQLFDR